MSQTQQDTQNGPVDARIIEEQHIAGSHGEDEIGAVDDRGRRWYHPRPEPPRRTDFMGFNRTWWMVLLWIVVIVLVVYPGPWW